MTCVECANRQIHHEYQCLASRRLSIKAEKHAYTCILFDFDLQCLILNVELVKCDILEFKRKKEASALNDRRSVIYANVRREIN